MIHRYELGSVATNTYLITKPGENSAVIIDPADYSQALLRDIADLGIADLTILVTHAHFDHFLGAEYLRNELGAKLGLHRLDLPLLKIKGGAELFGIDAPDIGAPDFFLTEKEPVNAGGYHFTVIHTPGHSSGHVCLYVPSEAVLFSGDLLFAGGVGRTDLPGGSHGQLLESVKSKILPLPGETVIYPGHGPSSTIVREAGENPWIKQSG